MKTKLILFWPMILLTIFSIESSSFQLIVPEMLVDQQASLLLYLQDQYGNQSVGKCQLTSSCRSRSIFQHELELTTCADAALIDATSVEAMFQQAKNQDSIVVCFEFDETVQVLRILVIKDCLLDSDPFDIVSLPMSSLDLDFDVVAQENQIDELAALTESITAGDVTELTRNAARQAWFEQYMAYAKIFMLMQYGKAQRAMRGMSSWLYS